MNKSLDGRHEPSIVPRHSGASSTAKGKKVVPIRDEHIMPLYAALAEVCPDRTMRAQYENILLLLEATGGSPWPR